MILFANFPPFHRRKDATTLQLITTQHQLSMCLIVQLRGDVEALGLGKEIAWSCTSYRVFVSTESKFGLSYFHPCGFHLSDGLHDVFVLFTSQLGNNAVDSEYFSHYLNA